MNEFKVDKVIGKGAFSKVKRVIRQFQEDGELKEEYYAMKVSET